MFSSRLPARADANALSRMVERLHASGDRYVDLTASNPTTAGLPYPDDLLSGLASPRARTYDPQPLGLLAAREAVAADYARHSVVVDPGSVVLSASTSEAYSWLFKLLCDPDDVVLIPRPSYPLFEHLTRMEGVRTASYELEYHGRWEIDIATLRAAPDRTRAVLLVSPHNPTGWRISESELDRLVTLCRDRGWALVADEVFADYPLESTSRPTVLAADSSVLCFTLGGASKTLGLPQLKLGWTIVGGPARERAAALAALEIIADTFLSVNTPVQEAAPALFAAAAATRSAIKDRLRRNLSQARGLAREHAACDLPPVEGGWSLVVRVPSTTGEEQLVLDLLERERILVHPGYFFDFPHETFLIPSLLPPEDLFADAFSRLLRFATA